MMNWLPTSPLLTRPPVQPDPRNMLAAFDGWSIAELLRNERFVQAPNESMSPTSAMNACAKPTSVSAQPDWLANAQWQSTSEIAPWPEPPSMPRPSLSEDPRYRDVNRIRRRTPSRYSPMGPPYLNEPPQDYPSHLGPEPQAPEWEEVVPTGTTPWSPLTELPRATAWGQVLTGIGCTRTEDGRHINCITPGGVRYDNVPAEGFPAYFGPGQPGYHSYNTARLGRRRNTTSGIVREPTPGANWNIAPAASEGTPNPAAPFYVQVLQYLLNRIPGVERGLGSPSWPVTSYRVVDQFGRPAVINVTASDHVGFPGVVIRTDERLPSGRHRVRNQGAGMSALQSPDLWRLFTDPRDWYTNHLWQSQSQNNIIRAYRNSRRNYPYGLPLE